MKATYTSQFKRLFINTLLLSALAGCGQSGPLYLPQQPTAENQPQQPDTSMTQSEQTKAQKKQEQ
jgi:predicted small lipoprotein YifL